VRRSLLMLTYQLVGMDIPAPYFRCVVLIKLEPVLAGVVFGHRELELLYLNFVRSKYRRWAAGASPSSFHCRA